MVFALLALRLLQESRYLPAERTSDGGAIQAFFWNCCESRRCRVTEERREYDCPLSGILNLCYQ